MSDNPYSPPSSITIQPNIEQRRKNTPRPVGVSILAVLHFIGGILLVGAQFLLFTHLQAMEESLRSVGISPIVLIIGVMFLAVLAIASSIGIWIGAKWGWWCASFYYMYSIFRNGSAFLTAFTLAEELEGGTRGLEYYLVKHGGRIIVHFLLFLYFFKGNVLEFFGLESISKPKAVVILVSICIAITAAIYVCGLLSS